MTRHTGSGAGSPGQKAGESRRAWAPMLQHRYRQAFMRLARP